ncbi:hypothetical protein AGMMS49938_06760 [Fibrobacterales bacterium]|nr:hypothetical protein AGMMS49938_06760 [Fibrobacterales bacterium]
MELKSITGAVTKTAVVLIFWAVLLLDLILEPSVSFKEIAFALIKAVVVSGIFWILFSMLVDTFLKTMIADTKEKQADRMYGGLSYHITEPSLEEKAWLRQQEREKEEHSR